MNSGKRLYALRGAVQCRNDEEDITLEVTALYRELLEQNGLKEDDIVSLVFSVTRDIDAKNPAAALRQSGQAGEIALFVVQEAFFVKGMERVIRTLMYCYMEDGSRPVHVYRNGAEALRPDRSGK
ncbi:MAG: chorismate mutase [Treponema sp.]|jgi:chorismate mutase|nr:chorismate mutase [Treponema sp.]